MLRAGLLCLALLDTVYAQAVNPEWWIGISADNCRYNVIAPYLYIEDCPQGYACRCECNYTCQNVKAHAVDWKLPDGNCSSSVFLAAMDIGDCPFGYECGCSECGYSCQKVNDQPPAGQCAELCGEECPEGEACRSNGCGHSCKPISPCTCPTTLYRDYEKYKSLGNP